MSRTLRRALVAAAACALTLVNAPLASALQANDPLVGQSWQLSSDAAMGVQTAWDQTTDARGVIVAVVDTGIDLSHPDLAGNLWTNPGEVPGNGVDDDHDGYVDDVHGADVLNHDGDPSDDNGHGTHVSGIIGARGNNGTGSTGIAWAVQLMAVKVLDANAAGDASTVADGVRYAVAHGARIVNLSLSGPGRSDDLESAIADAQAHGVLVVVAAGNDHQDLGQTPAYPASMPEPNILAVAASNDDGNLASISNYGGNVKLAAPGEGIISTARGGGYELRTGTSMAAPEVAGAAALVAAEAGPSAGWSTLSSALTRGARPTSMPVGGLLDAAGALRQVIPASQWRGPGTAVPASLPASTATRSSSKARKASTSRKSRVCKARTASKRRSSKSSRAKSRKHGKRSTRAHAASTKARKHKSSKHKSSKRKSSKRRSSKAHKASCTTAKARKASARKRHSSKRSKHHAKHRSTRSRARARAARADAGEAIVYRAA